MRIRALVTALLLFSTCVGRGAEGEAQDIDAVLAGLDGSGLMRQLQERQAKIDQLSPEEKIALDEARKKALEDPAVRAALAARNEAAQELAATLKANIIKADPTLAVFYAKTAMDAPGPN